MEFTFRFHPKVQIQAEVMTPFHVLRKEAEVAIVGTVSAKPSKSHILLTSSPASAKLRSRPLAEVSAFSNLPFSVGEVLSDGVRVGYLFTSSWTAINLFSGLLYVSGVWWETCRKPEIPEGSFPMLFKNSDLSIFYTHNKVGLIVCGEITPDLQELLRL